MAAPTVTIPSTRAGGLFTPQSRYAVVPDRLYTAADGSETLYKARRFAPQPSRLPLQQLATVGQGERLDVLTARALGPPELYWRIADANGAIDPFALVAVPGRQLRVPQPQAEEPLPSMES